ncbi:MAG TPA: hypothetical protein VIZ29_09825 [Gaiellaceae bacterium]
MAVPVVRQQRRRQEDGEGARRILDEDVPVRDAPVQEAARVVAVEPEIAVLAPAEEAPRRDSGGQQVGGR